MEEVPKKHQTELDDNAYLVADMIETGIFQYSDGSTSREMRGALKVLDLLKEKGLFEDDDAFDSARIGAMGAILLRETMEIDIADDLSSKAFDNLQINREAS